MIPAGRTAVDAAGIAELHGVALKTARMRRIWHQDGHPAPLSGARGPQGSLLWDAEQAIAYANGDPIPPLPEPGDELDLLDRAEAAEVAGITRAAWSRYESYDRTRPPDKPRLTPEPDAIVCGTPHWYRRTVEQYKTERAERAGKPRGGRPKGATEKRPRRDIALLVDALLDKAAADGEQITTAKIARQLGIAYTTALKHVARYRDTHD